MKFTYILVDAGYACRLGFSLLTEPLETIWKTMVEEITQLMLESFSTWDIQV
jgi:hypothetical protein